MMQNLPSLIIVGAFVATWGVWIFTRGISLSISFPHFAPKIFSSDIFDPIQHRKKWKIDGSTSVFFVETNRRISVLPPRVMCALESVARHNPDRQIYHIAQGDVGSQQYGDVLNHYPNIKFLTRNFRDLVENSPVESIFERKLNGTKFQVECTTDILRLLIPFSFGGVYLDTDVISLKHLPNISNFLVLFQRDYLNNAVSGFEPQHPFIYEALVSMAKDFRPEKWGYNGPDLVTRVAKEFCPKHGGTSNETLIDGVRSWKCGNIQMLNYSTTYPIHYKNFKQFLYPNSTLQVQDAISDSFAVHYWNKMIYWKKKKIILREDQPLYKIFRQNCPRTEFAHLRPLLNQPFHVRG